MKSIGLIVNPVAGMGGSVGLKGTDGDLYERAVALGAEPVSPDRVRVFLANTRRRNAVRWQVAPGSMGADYVAAEDVAFEVTGSVSARPRAEDTRLLARSMCDAGVDLVVFAGGDGTARDMVDAVDAEVPVVAIPAGVKVYSSVFAYSAAAAAAMLDAYIDGVDVAEEEVLDIDEDAYRDGHMQSRHYGYLLVPVVESLRQAGKESSGVGGSVAEAKEEIARVVVDCMQDDRLYLLGCGTTVGAVAEELGVDKTLLGIDAVARGKQVGRNLNERAILALLDDYDATTIVVTPLGGNGFIFGRGNRQFTPAVLRRVGRDNILVIANRDKLLTLPCLHVDTGDVEVDAMLSGYMDVVVAKNHRKLMRVQ